ncbi:unnamed protein product [Orchesella dallaii]|uniref:Uncharacterized protein n=1 Tax=Orchesella dallaii TaxID=48710 RepID=A0ABP1QLU5_9HEXA
MVWNGKKQYDTFINKDPTLRLSALDVTMVLLGTLTSVFFIHTAWTKAEMFRWLLETDPEGKSLLPQRNNKGILETNQNVLSIICPFASIFLYLFTSFKDIFQNKPGVFAMYEKGHPTPCILYLTMYGLVIVGHLFDVILQIVVLVFRDRLQYFLDMLESDNPAPEEVDN